MTSSSPARWRRSASWPTCSRTPASLRRSSRSARPRSVSVTRSPMPLRYIEAVDHPGVQAINGDVYHMQAEESHIGEAILQAGERLVNLHMADSNRCALGEGSLDLDAIIMALYLVGFNRDGCFVTPEPLGPAAIRIPRCTATRTRKCWTKWSAKPRPASGSARNRCCPLDQARRSPPRRAARAGKEAEHGEIWTRIRHLPQAEAQGSGGPCREGETGGNRMGRRHPCAARR